MSQKVVSDSELSAMHKYHWLLTNIFGINSLARRFTDLLGYSFRLGFFVNYKGTSRRRFWQLLLDNSRTRYLSLFLNPLTTMLVLKWTRFSIKFSFSFIKTNVVILQVYLKSRVSLLSDLSTFSFINVTRENRDDTRIGKSLFCITIFGCKYMSKIRIVSCSFDIINSLFARYTFAWFTVTQFSSLYPHLHSFSLKHVLFLFTHFLTRFVYLHTVGRKCHKNHAFPVRIFQILLLRDNILHSRALFVL